jgi:predicted ATPase/DNA-binding SARP family transcriptional activator
VRIKLLGGFDISVGSRSIENDEWQLRKARSLVKLLAVAPRCRLHRERVMEWLWPNSSRDAAANSLYQTVHHARRVIDPDSSGPFSPYLRLQDEELVLCPEVPLWTDVEAFESAAATARRTRDPASYQAAVELYTGDLLPEDRYEEWAEGRREELRALYQELLIELARLHEERGEFKSAIEALRRVLTSEPAHEQTHQDLMRLYATAGQRDRALRQYEQLREVLRRELGLEPDAASEYLYREISSGRFPPTEPASGGVRKAANVRRHNLPLQLTSFVGRQREMAEVRQLLAASRLVTLTGAGGSGKTRLAVAVANELLPEYPDGMWLVELAPLADPTLVPKAVAAALGVREEPGRDLLTTLVDYLRHRELLLLLDNCEHLVGACASLVQSLLRACPYLRILATSREGLRIGGEATWLVPSLSVPDTGILPPVRDLVEYEAVRLFVDRVRSHRPRFELTEENARSVAEICQRLDGIPLAIELAAARARAMTVEQIATRLDNSLRLLTGGDRTATPRQQTLKGTLEWSYDLLSRSERELFCRLSVIVGGFTLEVAEALMSAKQEEMAAEDVLQLLSQLVDKSLVVAEESGGGSLRYTMLEPVRQYGQQQLEESGKAERVRQRHAEHYLALAEEAEPELRGARQVSWLKRLEKEQDNLRAAMSWLLRNGELEKAARLGWALWFFWWIHGHFAEGRRWMEVALVKGAAMPASSRAKALLAASIMADGQADRRSAELLLEESLSLQGTGRQTRSWIRAEWCRARSSRPGAARARNGPSSRGCGSLPRGGGKVGCLCDT